MIQIKKTVFARGTVFFYKVNNAVFAKSTVLFRVDDMYCIIVTSGFAPCVCKKDCCFGIFES